MRNPFKRLFSRRTREEVYKCKRCGCVFPKKDAQLSGWADHPHGFHVHCPRCGATVDQFVKKPSGT